MMIGAGAPTQLRLAKTVGAVKVSDTSITLSTQLKSLGVIFDAKLTSDNHTSAVYKACNYHIWACDTF